MKSITKEQIEETARRVDAEGIKLTKDTNNRVLVNGKLYPLAFFLEECYKEIYGEDIPLQVRLQRKKYIEKLGFKVVRTATSFFFLGASWSKKDQTDRFIKDGI